MDESKLHENHTLDLQISRWISIQYRIWFVMYAQNELLNLLKFLISRSTMYILCY
jgi:hypothetical protein